MSLSKYALEQMYKAIILNESFHRNYSRIERTRLYMLVTFVINFLRTSQNNIFLKSLSYTLFILPCAILSIFFSSVATIPRHSTNDIDYQHY